MIARCYHAVTTWMGDCLQTGKLTNTKVNLSFHFYVVGKSSKFTGLSGLR